MWKVLASMVAEALAVMHWEVETDADYVEFLFPGGRPNESKRTDAVPAGALEKKGQGLIHDIGGYGEEWDG